MPRPLIRKYLNILVKLEALNDFIYSTRHGLPSIILNTYRIQVDNPGMKDPYSHT